MTGTAIFATTIDVTFDDSADQPVFLNCASGIPTIGCGSCDNDVIPVQPLDDNFQGFFGEDPAGDWALEVIDNFGGDNGALITWSIEFDLDSLDGDSISDCFDDCPNDSNEDQLDTDGDGLGDARDPDIDNDGQCDAGDDDTDNDVVDDADDIDPFNPLVCRDLDGDGCDDCASGLDDTANDGPDNDADGICDGSDADDDNDGVVDGADTDPFNPKVYQDLDADGCDDCSIGWDAFGPLPDFDPANDGTDTDGDGICDGGDADDDDDGVNDFGDPQPKNPFICGDFDGDFCDDCAVTGGPPDAANDGSDFDGDGLCDLGDPDDDNDGIPDVLDAAPFDPNAGDVAGQAVPGGNNPLIGIGLGVPFFPIVPVCGFGAMMPLSAMLLCLVGMKFHMRRRGRRKR